MTSVDNFTALSLSGPRQVEFVRHALPAPGAGQVLVKVHACGICGSDLRWYREGLQEATFFGHEFSGTVVAVGDDVHEFRPGDRVAAGLAAGCGACENCLRGYPNHCPTTREAFVSGGFGEYCLANVTGAFRPIAHLPDSIDEVTASLYEPLSCAVRIATRLPTAPGSRVLVLGLGTMGVFAGLLLKHDVSGVELVGADTNLSRVDFARRMGFHAAVQIVPGETASLRARLGDFDVVIDATGVAAVFSVAVELARLGGNVILGGVPAGTTPFAPLPIFRKELTVVGAKGPFPFTDGRGRDRVIELLASNHLPWPALVSPTPFGDAPEAFRGADRGDSLKSVLTFDH